MTETKRVKVDEDILRGCAGIDLRLPFRLQKRKLFEKLGFPADKKIVSMSIQNETRIKKMLVEFMEDEEEYLIITSPKPMLTWIPPLFRINRRDKSVVYRNEQGNIQLIELPEIFIKIKELPPKSWIEFARYLWKKDTVAGRLLYISAEEQILEIQRGVEIPEMDRTPSGSFRATFSFFELRGSFDERKLARQTGFEWYEVKRIVDCLSKHLQGFEDLKQIADFPAIEFAYTQQEGLIVIDVDWPAQYRF